MNNKTDNELAIKFRKQLINKNISIDYCKECYSFNIENSTMKCIMEIVTTENCNLLKIFYIN